MPQTGDVDVAYVDVVVVYVVADVFSVVFDVDVVFDVFLLMLFLVL